jgi:hypothetical protein
MLPHTAAGKYFERYKRVVDALDAIASDYNGDIIAQAKQITKFPRHR